MKVNNSLLPASNKVKFLGLHIDNTLNFKSHCEFIISKVNSQAYVMKNLRNILTEKQLISLYYAQIESRLSYAICFWGASVNAQNVFLSQKRVIRCMAGVGISHSCRTFFLKYKILTVPSLFIYELAVYTFLNKDIFSTNKQVTQTFTRQSENLHVPFAKYQLGSKSPNILGPKIYNKLPTNIKQCKELKSFKAKLRNFLVLKCYYAVSNFVNV